MKAIQTHYKGYRFRSRLEARWAVFFDTLGLAWEYEPEGFELEGFELDDVGTRYLPDFKIADTGIYPTLWIEVKPPGPIARADIDRVWRFADLCLAGVQHGGVLVTRGDPMDGEMLLTGTFHGVRKTGILTLASESNFTDFWKEASNTDIDTVRSAACKARGARFEFEEKG